MNMMYIFFPEIISWSNVRIDDKKIPLKRNYHDLNLIVLFISREIVLLFEQEEWKK